jgi:ATP-dependent Lon protease
MSKRRREESDSDPEYEPGDSDQDLESDFPELRHCDKKTHAEFVAIQKEVEKTEPNIASILNTPMLLCDKTELFQLFEIYGNMHDEVSTAKLDLKKHIQTKLDQAIVKYKQYQRYSEEEHKKFSREIENLEQYDENEELKYDIVKLETSQANKRIIYHEYKRMSGMSLSDDELPKLRNWMNWALSIPHDRMKRIDLNKQELTKFLQKVSRKMDDELYGMQKVKEQILLFLNSRIVNPNMQKCSLGLLGPPGCGKTTIVKILADLLDFPLEQISLGGVQSPEFLKGHQYTYIGAEPGEIVKCLKRMKVKNGILFFDEYDKVSVNKEVCSALLHITDSSQNSKFQDNYLSGITIDLSYLWFFYSMNQRPDDDALADRIFYVTIEGYSQLDKFFIVKDYLLRKAHKNMGWEPNSVTITDDAITYLVDKISPPSNPGIRTLDHAITTIANKINFLYHHQNKQGRMTSFKTTFDIGKKLSFPFCLGREKINMFLSGS